jgi:signal transduction histidine kinase
MHSHVPVATVDAVGSFQQVRAPGTRWFAHGLTERQWVLLDAVAAVLGLLVGVIYLRDSRLGAVHGQPDDIILALFAGAPVLFRRLFPLPAFAISAAAIAALLALGSSPLPLSTMLALTGYMVAARAPRRLSLPALVLGEAALLIALALSGGSGKGPETIEAVLLLAVAWCVGDGVSARRAYLAEQRERDRATDADRARQAVRDERVRIARDLHDVIAHSLAVITVQAGAGRRLMAKRPEQAAIALESIEATGRSAQDELQVVLGLLREEVGSPSGLAPVPGLADLGQLVDTVRAAGTAVEFHASGTNRPMSAALELSVYRVVQEALTNVVKHAPGARATVDVSVSEGEVSIEVGDDGGAPTSQLRPSPSGPPAQPGTRHGIVGMRERVGAFGGSLMAGPLPGHGFRVSARVPLPFGP